MPSMIGLQVPYGSLTLHFAGLFSVAMVSLPSIRILTWQPGSGHLNLAKDVALKSLLQGLSAMDQTTDVFIAWKLVSEVCWSSSVESCACCTSNCAASHAAHALHDNYRVGFAIVHSTEHPSIGHSKGPGQSLCAGAGVTPQTCAGHLYTQGAVSQAVTGTIWVPCSQSVM